MKQRLMRLALVLVIFGSGATFVDFLRLAQSRGDNRLGIILTMLTGAYLLMLVSVYSPVKRDEKIQ
jgi:hypothetical protein